MAGFETWASGSCAYKCALCVCTTKDEDAAAAAWTTAAKFWEHVRAEHGLSPAAYKTAVTPNYRIK